MGSIQERNYRICGHWACEKETLSQIAIESSERRELPISLYTLADYGHP